MTGLLSPCIFNNNKGLYNCKCDHLDDHMQLCGDGANTMPVQIDSPERRSPCSLHRRRRITNVIIGQDSEKPVPVRTRQKLHINKLHRNKGIERKIFWQLII